MHCLECGKPFPSELPEGLAQFPRFCRACRAERTERRAEAAEHRDNDRNLGRQENGTTRPPANEPPAPAKRGRPRRHPPTGGKASRIGARGGFVPRRTSGNRELRRLDRRRQAPRKAAKREFSGQAL